MLRRPLVGLAVAALGRVPADGECAGGWLSSEWDLWQHISLACRLHLVGMPGERVSRDPRTTGMGTRSPSHQQIGSVQHEPSLRSSSVPYPAGVLGRLKHMALLLSHCGCWTSVPADGAGPADY